MGRPLLKIGITQTERYGVYENWILHSPEGAEVIELCAQKDNISDLDECDGLIFTGGEDIHPQRYKSPEFYENLELGRTDQKRDAFEWRLAERALTTSKSMLGICRGLQLMNICLGGDLIYDIPTADCHTSFASKDARHQVTLQPGSLLAAIGGNQTGSVNSSHHQAPDRIAPDLSATAWSDIPAAETVPIVEGLEWKQPAGKPWLLLVQWHPERMEDQQNPLAAGIRKAFLTSIKR